MANGFGFSFVDVHVEKNKIGGGARHDHEVYLKGKTSKSQFYNKVIISSDLLKEAGWVEGDRVTIMKSQEIDNVFAIRRQNEGNGKGELKLVNCGQQLCLSGINVCIVFNPSKNGDVFDAWYDKSDKIIMRPKKKDA